MGEAAGNGTKAAELAGYAKGSARITASQLLRREDIQAELEAKRDRVLAKVNNPDDIEAARLITELSVIAFSDIRNLFDADGNLRPVHELEDGPARALAAVEVSREKTTRGEETSTTEYVVKVKQWDKLRAIELIGKLRGLFPSEKHLHGHVHMTLERLVSGHVGD